MQRAGIANLPSTAGKSRRKSRKARTLLPAPDLRNRYKQPWDISYVQNFARLALALLVLLSACAGRVDMEKLAVTSDAFENGGTIPKEHTCDGDDVSPPLSIAGLPEGTKSVAIIMDDPDAPGGTFVHWVAWNLPKKPTISEGTSEGESGENDFGRSGYGGPCPPPGKAHRYFFKVYALDLIPEPASATRKGLEAAMKGHVLQQGELMGTYRR